MWQEAKRYQQTDKRRYKALARYRNDKDMRRSEKMGRKNLKQFIEDMQDTMKNEELLIELLSNILNKLDDIQEEIILRIGKTYRVTYEMNDEMYDKKVGAINERQAERYIKDFQRIEGIDIINIVKVEEIEEE
jgi:hypothetical protein